MIEKLEKLANLWISLDPFDSKNEIKKYLEEGNETELSKRLLNRISI
jgi:hypothetical protein